MSKKILLISHDLTNTGAPASLLRQACYFKKAGFDVDVYSFGDGSFRYEYIANGFNPIIIKNTKKDISNTFKKIKKYKLIICNTIITYKAVNVLKKKKIPLIWFIRETNLIHIFYKNNPAFRKEFSTFNNLYTVSDYAAKVIKKYNPCVRVIYNSILDKFKKINKTKQKLIFGYIGSIIPIKGVDILIESFNKVSSRYNKLLIAGDYNNDYAKKLKNKSNKNIKFLGEVCNKDKEKFFKKIDVLVVPSLDEPFGLTVAEGAMYGKAIITTNKTGAKFLVKNNKNGFIVKAKNIDDLSEHIKKMTKKTVKEMKKESRNMYLKYCHPDKERSNVLGLLNIG